MDDNIFIEYTKLLDDSKEHLSSETVATYINLQQNLSEKENNFVEKHLEICAECYIKYANIFDEDFDIDEGKRVWQFNNQDLIVSDENQKKYADPKLGIEFTIKKNTDSNFYLIFSSLPEAFKEKSIRLKLQKNNSVFRIVAAREEKQYKLYQKKIKEISEINIIHLELYEDKNTGKRRKFSFYPYAAAVIVLLALSLFLIYYLRNDGEETAEQNFVPSAKEFSEQKREEIIPPPLNKEPVLPDKNIVEKEKPEPRINKRDFAENKMYERFIDRNLRSSDKLEIISPALGDTLKTQIKFRWTPLPGAEVYTLTIVSNRNQKIWEKRFDYTSVTYLDKLNPGLYYWLINANDKLMAVGKFFVE